MSGPVATFLGPTGTFTHQAVLALRPDAVAVAVETQADALAAVTAGESTYAVLPIDNSVNGVVVPTLDGLLQHPDLAVVDSVVLPISFHAFTADPDVEATVVVSHPHALAQCRAWIEARGLQTRESSSTAAACRDLVPGEIGIGPAVCGSLYPIEVVAEAVEDNDVAHTQFALVAPTSTGAATGTSTGTASGGDGLLLALWPTTNVPGLLRRFLAVLEERDVNMTNLVTRPIPSTPGIFCFLLFLAGGADGAVSDEQLAAMRAEWAELGCEARAIGRISPLAEMSPP